MEPTEERILQLRVEQQDLGMRLPLQQGPELLRTLDRLTAIRRELGGTGPGAGPGWEVTMETGLDVRILEHLRVVGKCTAQGMQRRLDNVSMSDTWTALNGLVRAGRVCRHRGPRWDVWFTLEG